jgi:LEA14-like dessication related protein
MTMLETTLQVTVRISNPNPDPLALEGAAFKLRLDGHKVGSGMTPDELTVPRLESRTLQIAFHLSNPATILRLPTIVDSRSVDWSLNGKLYVRTSLGRRTLKVAQQGHLDLGELEEPSDARLSPGEEIQ